MVLRKEWDKWLRSVTLYIETEDITNHIKQKSKLLPFGETQLQEFVYNLTTAMEEYDSVINNDVLQAIVSKLNGYFSLEKNSIFERHLFRQIRLVNGKARGTKT